MFKNKIVKALKDLQMMIVDPANLQFFHSNPNVIEEIGIKVEKFLVNNKMNTKEEARLLLKKLQDQLLDPVNQLYFLENPMVLKTIQENVERLKKSLLR